MLAADAGQHVTSTACCRDAAAARGVGPTVQRAVLLTAAQFGTYDEIKYTLLRQGLLEEGPAAHFVASTLAGLAVATTTNPIDVVKTRIMNQPFDKVRTVCGCAWLCGCKRASS